MSTRIDNQNILHLTTNVQTKTFPLYTPRIPIDSVRLSTQPGSAIMSSTQKQKTPRTFRERFRFFGEHITGNPPWWKFRHFNDFEEWLHRPVDAASLGVCRMLFGNYICVLTLISFKKNLRQTILTHNAGLVMLVDIAEERGGAALYEKWNNPRLCHFPIFSGLVAMNATRMGVVFAIMWIGEYRYTRERRNLRTVLCRL